MVFINKTLQLFCSRAKTIAVGLWWTFCLTCKKFLSKNLENIWSYFRKGVSSGNGSPSVTGKLRGLNCWSMINNFFCCYQPWLIFIIFWLRIYVTPLPFSPVQFQYNCYYTKETNRSSHSDTSRVKSYLYFWDQSHVIIVWNTRETSDIDGAMFQFFLTTSFRNRR